jgi:four helix bundle protein
MANQSTAYSSLTQESLKRRTREFALAGIRLVRVLPKDQEGYVIGRQLIRAATSVGANYRTACRGRSRREFIARLGIVIEEADECLFWLELLEETNAGPEPERTALKREAHELVSIFVVTRYRAAKSTGRR